MSNIISINVVQLPCFFFEWLINVILSCTSPPLLSSFFSSRREHFPECPLGSTPGKNKYTSSTNHYVFFRRIGETCQSNSMRLTKLNCQTGCNYNIQYNFVSGFDRHEDNLIMWYPLKHHLFIWKPIFSLFPIYQVI